MNIFDKIRIKRKIRKVCKIIRNLSQDDQNEIVRFIISCLRQTCDWKKKEQLFDMILERLW